VFRTSTAEPKKNGIVWEYVKDMSQYVLSSRIKALSNGDPVSCISGNLPKF
jgi:hypothetical protein